MTEAEWLECHDPIPMLEFLKGKASDRKLRLFTVSCCRSIWHLLKDERLQQAVNVAESFADGTASAKELADARGIVREVGGLPNESTAVRAVWSTTCNAIGSKAAAGCKAAIAALGRYLSITRSGKEWTVGSAEPLAPVYTADVVEEMMKQAQLLRDIFGNPFGPIALNPSWLNSTVLALAHQMYESRDCSPMPILADALQDAGCDNEEVLHHCRCNGVHVRGCFVLDLLLGKE
jgi:hypothetical protein